MTHIEVVREALQQLTFDFANGDDPMELEPKSWPTEGKRDDALAALDSLEAELAETRVGGGYALNRALKAEAELARWKEAVEEIGAERDIEVTENRRLEAELAQVREERDAAVRKWAACEVFWDTTDEWPLDLAYGKQADAWDLMCAALTEETGLPPDIANVSWKTSKITYDPMWAIQPEEEPS